MLAVAYLLAGAVGVVAGVWVLFGIGWALLAAGVLLLGLGALEARGGQPAEPAEPMRGGVGAIRSQVPTAAEAAAQRRSA